MTTDEGPAAPDLHRLEANLKKIEDLSRRLVAAMARKRPVDPSLQGPGPELYSRAAAAWMAEMMANPARIIEHQVSYWGETLRHYLEAQKMLAGGDRGPEDDTDRSDRRFASPLWRANPYFRFLRDQYLLNLEAVRKIVRDIEGLDDHDRKRLEYFATQMVEMFSPANFLATNPEALARAVETDGESLVRGLENLVRDLEANDGELLVSLADRNAFAVGENLATTPGAVIFRNRMMELIQYAPTTEKVRRVPLIIFPPWINKFYILDLRPDNSLIRWIVDQGYTLFVVSWVNPDETYADVGMDTYIEEGYLAAIDEVRRITGEKKVNAVGYCIAGTTLALTLALLHRRGESPVRSATFLTTLTDFSDQGEFEVFLDNDFVDGIEEEAGREGCLRSFIMSRTFSFLRSNDLIYAPAIRRYMLGEPPPAFDLLYWNGDGTNLPGRMAVEYLRWLCQDNRFAEGRLELCGEKLSIRDVKVPLCAVGCESDHIAKWSSSYDGIRRMGAKDKTFILSQSGHIAGIINPPGRKKYGHYTNPDLAQPAEGWREGATFHDGSWWPRWEAWLRRRSGALVKARTPGDSGRPVLGPAPGTYVLARASG